MYYESTTYGHYVAAIIAAIGVTLSIYYIEGKDYLNLSNPRSVNGRKVIKESQKY